MADSFDQLIAVANKFGRDPEYSRGGGGNASVKDDGVLYIKPSGVPLATLKREDLVPLRIDVLIDAFDEEPPEQGDPVMIAAARALVRDTGRRPSVEILFHALIPSKLVLHSHPLVANALTCNEDAQKLALDLLGDDAILVPYTDPGVPLAKKVREVREAYVARTGNPAPGITLLGNHGIIIAGDTDAEIERLSARLTDTVAAAIEKTAASEAPVLDQAALDVALTHVAPALRGKLGGVVTADCSDLTRSVTLTPAGDAIMHGGPLIPDQIVYAGSFPLVLDVAGVGDESLVAHVGAAVDSYEAQHGKLPVVAVIPGLVAFAVGKDLKSARTAVGTFTDALRVARDAERLGSVRVMSERERTFIENWEAESYRKAVAAGSNTGRLDGKVVVVTGAAQGFGLGIASELIKEGAQLVLGDLNVELAAAEAAKLCAAFGEDRAIAAKVDVSDADSALAFVRDICAVVGGADVFISNAGVLRAGSVLDQPVADFDLVTNVNYRGYFLCVRAVAPVMARQFEANPAQWLDIIEINSKSGLEGSKRNFAYSGSKFGGIGLTQSFALELVECGIKVNAICPGNFLDGPLWTDPERGLFVQYLRNGKVPGAKTIDDVRAFYEAKVPMGRGCVPADLAKAICYVVDQDYETGQAIPVTGGQNMLS